MPLKSNKQTAHKLAHSTPFQEAALSGWGCFWPRNPCSVPIPRIRLEESISIVNHGIRMQQQIKDLESDLLRASDKAEKAEQALAEHNAEEVAKAEAKREALMKVLGYAEGRHLEGFAGSIPDPPR